MSTTTKKLGLFKYEPEADADKAFDVEMALNENWDKVDTAFGDMAGRMQSFVVVQVPANGWSAAAPYTQTVSVAGMQAEYAPIIDLDIPERATAAAVKIAEKQYSALSDAENGDGTITFTCFHKKPTNNFYVKVRMV